MCKEVCFLGKITATTIAYFVMSAQKQNSKMKIKGQEKIVNL